MKFGKTSLSWFLAGLIFTTPVTALSKDAAPQEEVPCGGSVTVDLQIKAPLAGKKKGKTVTSPVRPFAQGKIVLDYKNETVGIYLYSVPSRGIVYTPSVIFFDMRVSGNRRKFPAVKNIKIQNNKGEFLFAPAPDKKVARDIYETNKITCGRGPSPEKPVKPVPVVSPNTGPKII